MTCIQRFAGRGYNQLRPMHITYESFGFADASVLFKIGRTKVLCSVTLQAGVPPFLKGKKTGWLNAEYAMLPTATKQRTQRASTQSQQNGRSVEISRLIGRVLRSVVNLDVLGERTIIIDCDVLQADGGTRSAAITGASLALHKAQEYWLEQRIITAPLITQRIGAISVGVSGDACLLDIDFTEDSNIDADFNIILTESKHIIEIQGTAEQKPVSWDTFDTIKHLACKGIEQLFVGIDLGQSPRVQEFSSKAQAPMFSLQKRLNLS
jgi:ribonuclease PH